MTAPSKRRIWIARGIAAGADVTQWLLFPLFSPGALSPAEDVLDAAVAVAVTWLVGWHWAFVPGFLAELVPGLDLAPTWTAAVWFATRKAAPPRDNPALES